MRLATFLGITVILLTSCGHLPVPDKPKLEMGVMDYPRGEVITNKLDLSKITSSRQVHYDVVVKSLKSSKYKRVPISDYDRSIMFKPSAWEQEQNYIDKLEDYARNRCN